MIVVRFTKDTMYVEGHANRGKKAVAVCAGGSVILQALAFITKGSVIKSGYFAIPMRKRSAELVFTVYALRCLADSYPGNIRVERCPSWLKHKRRPRL